MCEQGGLGGLNTHLRCILHILGSTTTTTVKEDSVSFSCYYYYFIPIIIFGTMINHDDNQEHRNVRYPHVSVFVVDLLFFLLPQI